jgi:hypothetical protein
MNHNKFCIGWFGRGVAGSSAAQRYKALNTEFLQKPARKQKDFIDPKKYHLEGSNEFNIWYGRFIGDIPERGAKQEAAADRCVIETDAGYTKADSGGDKRKEKRFFCIHFAHGVCAKGKDCTYYHRIPTPEDDAKCDELFDCFGRQRHSAHRDDMDGVGSFMKPCRTLFVGNLLKHKYSSPKELEDALWKHFGEWGELESLNVIQRLSIAFPRYRLRTSAGMHSVIYIIIVNSNICFVPYYTMLHTEFAKEAMQGQSLDQGEIISVRWAYDDPNPVAQDSISRADKDALTALLTAKGVSIAPAPFEYPSDYQLPDAKRLKLENGVDITQDHPELVYPNTDDQYTKSQQPVTSLESMTQSKYDAYYQNYYSQILTGTVPSNSTNAEISNTETPKEEQNKKEISSFLSNLLDLKEMKTNKNATINSAPDKVLDDNPSSTTQVIPKLLEGWSEHVDEDTGATYYYNSLSGESSWEIPSKNE